MGWQEHQAQFHAVDISDSRSATYSHMHQAAALQYIAILKQPLEALGAFSALYPMPSDIPVPAWPKITCI